MGPPPPQPQIPEFGPGRPWDPYLRIGGIGGSRSPLSISKNVVIGPILSQKTVWPMYALVYPAGPVAGASPQTRPRYTTPAPQLAGAPRVESPRDPSPTLSRQLAGAGGKGSSQFRRLSGGGWGGRREGGGLERTGFGCWGCAHWECGAPATPGIGGMARSSQGITSPAAETSPDCW